MLTSSRAVRAQFWREYLEWTGLGRKPRAWHGKTHNALPADVRMSFADWLDQAVWQGQVSERLAQSVTL